MKQGPIRLKSGDDIERIAEAGRIIAGIFEALSGQDLAGQRTGDIDRFIASRIIQAKARAAFLTVPRYPAASCISVNHEVVHGVPSKKKVLKPGDVAKIDVGVVMNGFFCDACRTFLVSPVQESTVRLVSAAAQCLMAGIAAMVPGARLGDLGHAIEDAARADGYRVIREYTGHGTGFALHEAPPIPHVGISGSGLMFREGMVLAIEPIITAGTGQVKLMEDGWTAVTADGSLAAQFEHTVAVTSRGPRILSA